jgi:acyl-CoA synthetase (NDP forming)/GNAT superfamily N-acetyltransferase
MTTVPGMSGVSPREWTAPESDVLLSDGTIAVIRSLRDGDRDAVLALHEGVSEDTLRLRFFTASRSAGRAYVARLFDPAQRSAFALVGVVRGRVAGLATGEVTGPERAEVAFLVSDQDRGRGLGSLLLEHLAALGREHGLTRFDADVLLENHGMMRVFRGAGFAVSRHSQEGEVSVELRTDVSAAALDASDRREWRSEARSLRPLLDPASVAFVGVRRSRGGVGRAVLDAITQGGYAGRLCVVHPAAEDEGGRIAGLPAYPRVADIPDKVDLAVVVVPDEQLVPAMTDVCSAGVGAAVVVSPGVTGGGPGTYRELVRLARTHSVRLVGPDSQGVLAVGAQGTLNATFARSVPDAGGLAVATQSGGVGFTVLDLARDQGVGVHALVSLGAKLDVSSNDLLAAWGDDDRVGVGALYLESFGNALKFARTARRFAERKPLLAVVGGRSASGVGVAALFAQAGVIPCRGAADIAEAAAVLTQQPLPAGFRVGVVTNAGGMGVIAAGMAEGEGLSVPRLSDRSQDALRAVVPLVSAVNPVDVGAAVAPASLEAALRVLLESGEVDAALVPLVPTTLADPHALRLAVAAAGTGTGKPVVVVASDARAADRVPGLTTYRTPLVAVIALARAMRYAAWRRVPSGDASPTAPGRASAARTWATARLAARQGRPEWLPAEAAAELLAPYGVHVQPVDDGVELSVTMERDPTFGPMVHVAAGGVAARIAQDEVHLLAPVTRSDAARVLRGLRMWPLLDGLRGQERVDVDALEALVVAAGQLAVDVPDVAHLDLDPVVARPDGVHCAGVKVLLSPAEAVDTGFPRRLRPT